MTKDEKLKRIEDIEKELAELKESIKEEDENNQLCWEPKLGERFYYITDYVEPYSEIWSDCIIDNINRERLAIGNVFKTKVEADFAIEKLKVIHELKQFAISKDKWSKGTPWTIGLNFDLNSLTIMNAGCHIKYGEIYFSTRKMAEKAIKAVGEERVKKYYLCVEEEQYDSRRN